MHSWDERDPKNSLELACLTAAAVNRLSLNTVRIVVGGTMTVDVKAFRRKSLPSISSSRRARRDVEERHA